MMIGRAERWWAGYLNVVLTVCARCGGRAVITPSTDRPAPEVFSQLLFHPRLLRCDVCGSTRSWAAMSGEGPPRPRLAVGEDRDPWFALPLWIQGPCGRNTLAVYNAGHLREMTAILEGDDAVLPSGRPRPCLEVLPDWVARTPREEVLAAARRLTVRASERATHIV